MKSEGSELRYLNEIWGIVFIAFLVLTFNPIYCIFLFFILIFLGNGFTIEKRRLKRIEDTIFYYPPDDLSPKKVEKLLLLDKYQGLLFILNLIAFFLFWAHPFSRIESEGMTLSYSIAVMFFTLVWLFDFYLLGKELAHKIVRVTSEE